MIERQKSRYGWEFIFLGANIDSAEEGARLGIEKEFTVDYHSDDMGTRATYAAMNKAIKCVREYGAPLGAGWQDEVERDNRRRK